MSYRDRYRPIIARLLATHQPKPWKELRVILRQAFPDPPREGWPYRVWLDEIRVQLGLRKWRRRRPKPPQPMLFDVRR